MERYFNIAGPCFPDEHYMLPAHDRLPEIRRLVREDGPGYASESITVKEKLYNRDVAFGGKTLHVVGL